MTAGFVPSVGAKDLALVGNVSYTISGTSIAIKADKVANYRSGGTSGTLRLEVWATSSPYSGGKITGYVMGTSVLGVLKGGYNFPSVNKSATFTSPPSGSYYITMTLEEYTASGYVIVDYANFSGTKQFGPGGTVSANLKLQGQASWNGSGSTITIKVAKVVNNSTDGTSGALRLRIWATQSQYSGGSINGYVLGSVALSPLKGGHYYSSISKTGTYTKPPNGTYYTTLTLEEAQLGTYSIKDYINMSSTSTFGPVTPTPNPGYKADWFTLQSQASGVSAMNKTNYLMLRSLGLASSPIGGRGVQLWSYCAAAMSYYNVYKSNPTTANWNAHAQTAQLAWAFFQRAPWD